MSASAVHLFVGRESLPEITIENMKIYQQNCIEIFCLFYVRESGYVVDFFRGYDMQCRKKFPLTS